jgi:5'-nucleotidase
MNWIQTYSGIAFNLDDPKPGDVRVEDIAHSLSMQCRFGGHVRRFYSVAEHCVRVSQIVRPKLQLAALLHDASEAYVIDVPRPVKMMLTGYDEIEARAQRAIAKRFGIDPDLLTCPEVKLADDTLLATERRDLLVPTDHEWAPLPPPLEEKIVPYYYPYEQFRDRFADLLR